MEYLESDFFLIALTFAVFFAAKRLQARTGWVVLNPILLSILFLMGFLKLTGVPYSSYAESASIIDFWLKPAIVALGVPLYLQLKSIRRQLVPLLVSQLIGCFVGIVSVVFTAKWMGASDAVIISLAPKSVTTPIAMEVSASLQGIPSLTAAIVVLVGLFGAVSRGLLPKSGVPVDYVFDGFESCMSECLMGRNVILLCDRSCVDLVESKIRRLEDFGTVVDWRVLEG